MPSQYVLLYYSVIVCLFLNKSAFFVWFQLLKCDGLLHFSDLYHLGRKLTTIFIINSLFSRWNVRKMWKMSVNNSKRPRGCLQITYFLRPTDQNPKIFSLTWHKREKHKILISLNNRLLGVFAWKICQMIYLLSKYFQIHVLTID